MSNVAVAYKEAFEFDQAEDVAEQTRAAKEWADKVFAENPSSIFDDFSAAEWASRDEIGRASCRERV